MTYPQPGGIVGIRRYDDLLSLEQNTLPRRETMLAMALTLWSAALSSTALVPSGAKLWGRMDNPVIGDLVVENTRPDPVRGIGLLLDRRTEWACTDAEWVEWQVEDGEYPRPTDYAYYVQYGCAPEDVCRWTNASFIAVPMERLFGP